MILELLKKWNDENDPCKDLLYCGLCDDSECHDCKIDWVQEIKKLEGFKIYKGKYEKIKANLGYSIYNHPEDQ